MALLRQGRKQPKNLYLVTPEEPDGVLVGQAQEAWVASQIVKRWNLAARSHHCMVLPGTDICSTCGEDVGSKVGGTRVDATHEVWDPVTQKSTFCSHTSFAI